MVASGDSEQEFGWQSLGETIRPVTCLLVVSQPFGIPDSFSDHGCIGITTEGYYGAVPVF
jgi:hypothetical protein